MLIKSESDWQVTSMSIIWLWYCTEVLQDIIIEENFEKDAEAHPVLFLTNICVNLQSSQIKSWI